MNTTYALSPFIDPVIVRVGKGLSPRSNVAASKMMTMYAIPRKAFLEDFQQEIESRTDAGDALVICGDINDDILGDTVVEFFEDLGLRHLIFSKHDSAQAPPTCTRVTKSNRAVDGIWASPCLDLVRGGYLTQAIISWRSLVNLV